MATVLEKYNETKMRMSGQINNVTFTLEHLLQYQELLYRINVLESCMTFCRTAPVTADLHRMSYHYQLLDAFLSCLLQERRIGLPGDEKVKMQRDTAYNNFQTVVNTFRRKFQSFAPSAQDEYRNTIAAMISTILPVWMSYRNTYVSL